MGGAGFEPAKAVPPDLQSGPFGRLGIHPESRSRPVARGVPLVSAGGCGVVPMASRLADPRRGRAGGETRTHNPRFTKPMLCRLSYASIPTATMTFPVSSHSRTGTGGDSPGP